MNWTRIMQQRISEEIQERKVHYPPTICIYSAFYILCLYEGLGQTVGLIPPRPLSPISPTLEEIGVQRAMTNMKIAELQRQLTEK